jgi:hypothetical protein
VVFDSGNVAIYVNGEVQDSKPTGAIPASLTSGSEQNLTVGTDPLPSFVQDGLMSRLCIWAGTALTACQVAEDFNAWIGVDPASNEPVTPTHAWRLDEASGTRRDCIGNIDLSDNNGTGSEAHITQVDDLSGNGFHARMRPINGPMLVTTSLGGKPTVRHIADNWQFLICGRLSGPTKPPAWSLYALAMCTDTAPASQQTSQGLFNTFADPEDVKTWIVCVLSDHGSQAPSGSFGMGCGDDTHYNQANAPGATYAANVWFQLTGIFQGGTTRVNTWFNGVAPQMAPITLSQPCPCAGAAYPAVIGAATAEGTGISGFAPYDNDFFDGQWADIAVCRADTTSQREAEEAFQTNLLWMHGVPGAASDVLVAPGNSPTSWYSTPENVQHIAYVGTDQTIHELFFAIRPDGQWTHGAPGGVATAPQVAAGTSPTSWYTTPENFQHIAYVGADDQRIHELFFQIGGSGGWVHNPNDVPGVADDAPPVASGTSPTTWYTTPENVEHIAYVGTDQRIQEVHRAVGPDGKWRRDKSDIPGAASDVLVAPGTSPTSWYTTPENVQHIAYVGTDQSIHELFFAIRPNGQWTHRVPGAASDVLVAPGTSPTSWYTTPENVQHIAYVGTDQRIHELFYFIP